MRRELVPISRTRMDQKRSSLVGAFQVEIDSLRHQICILHGTACLLRQATLTITVPSMSCLTGDHANNLLVCHFTTTTTTHTQTIAFAHSQRHNAYSSKCDLVLPLRRCTSKLCDGELHHPTAALLGDMSHLLRAVRCRSLSSDTTLPTYLRARVHQEMAEDGSWKQ